MMMMIIIIVVPCGFIQRGYLTGQELYHVVYHQNLVVSNTAMLNNIGGRFIRSSRMNLPPTLFNIALIGNVVINNAVFRYFDVFLFLRLLFLVLSIIGYLFFRLKRNIAEADPYPSTTNPPLISS